MRAAFNQLRVVGAESVGEVERSLKGGSTVVMPAAQSRYRDPLNVGREIVDSLAAGSAKGFYTLAVTIPEGISDVEALNSLNILARQRFACPFIEKRSQGIFEDLAKDFGSEISKRSYSVILLVDGTENRDYRQSKKRLSECDLTPADVFQTAIVLLASTIKERGKCFIPDYTVRTADPSVSLSFVSVYQKLFLIEGDVAPSMQTQMAATPHSPAHQRGFVARFFERFGRH